MKKVVTGAAIVASLFILSGCGNSSKTSTQSSSHHKETATNVKKEKLLRLIIRALSLLTIASSQFKEERKKISVFIFSIRVVKLRIRLQVILKAYFILMKTTMMQRLSHITLQSMILTQILILFPTNLIKITLTSLRFIKK
ncbi:hypothetical protein QTM68_08495 [Lactiplantibacillus plantarum]|uniref:hypothetical protein n=1 Tax=Lactiplantibacillus plantarum TaxID=1590 RepID=UPI00222ED8E5|nr:hypothetical protein [Lactiplantibacillus plantarum]UZF03986.1 hypothetical protein NYQ69_08485 [Lactiplantibacillus plantarum]WJM30553.1 hypothetical protein QTM68_08495 [Lactiplantibacillus plantarum]